MKCNVCGREITDPQSVKREIGPVCYSRLKREESRESYPGERILTRGMGGEIESLINETEGRSFSCLGGSSSHFEVAGQWYGYPHDGGLTDKSGRKWWAYQKCSVSNYEMAWWKVQRRIRNQEILEVFQ